MLDISFELSATQMIHMKYQALFSLKKEKPGFLLPFRMVL